MGRRASIPSGQSRGAAMTGDNMPVAGRSKLRWPITAAWLLATLMAPAAIAIAEDAQPPSANGAGQFPPAQAPASVPARGEFPVQPPPSEKPGFIYEFGRWWDGTRGKFEELGKQSDAAAKDAATATQGAVSSAAQATRGAADATEDAMKSAAEATKNAATTLF